MRLVLAYLPQIQNAPKKNWHADSGLHKKSMPFVGTRTSCFRRGSRWGTVKIRRLRYSGVVVYHATPHVNSLSLPQNFPTPILHETFSLVFSEHGAAAYRKSAAPPATRPGAEGNQQL